MYNYRLTIEKLEYDLRYLNGILNEIDNYSLGKLLKQAFNSSIKTNEYIYKSNGFIFKINTSKIGTTVTINIEDSKQDTLEILNGFYDLYDRKDGGFYRLNGKWDNLLKKTIDQIKENEINHLKLSVLNLENNIENLKTLFDLKIKKFEDLF